MNITARLILPVYLANCRYNNALLSTNRICKITITIALPTYTTYTTHLPLRPIINTLIHVQIDSSREWKFFSPLPPPNRHEPPFNRRIFLDQVDHYYYYYFFFKFLRIVETRWTVAEKRVTPTITSVDRIPEVQRVVVQFSNRTPRIIYFAQIGRRLCVLQLNDKTEILLGRGERDTNCRTSRSPCFSINPWTAARSILPSFFFFIQP